MGWRVDLSEFIGEFEQMPLSDVHPAMMSAIQCLRAEGIKTAVLTNYFNLPNRRHLSLLDASLLDLVTTRLVSVSVSLSLK